MIDRELDLSAESPERAILLHSPGRKPWVNRRNTFIEPCKGGTFPTNAKPQTTKPQSHKPNTNAESAAPTELNPLLYCLPRVAFRALPSFHPGLCGSVVPTALTPAPNNKSDNKHKQRHQPTNTTTNANNDTAQPIRQQA